MVGGNMEVGIEVWFKNLQYFVLIVIIYVLEFFIIKVIDSGVEIGLFVMFINIFEIFFEIVKMWNEDEILGCKVIIEQFWWFVGV